MGRKCSREFSGWVLALPLVLLILTPIRKTSPQQEQPTIRVTTHLVQVNVIVQDKHGQPVPDLTRDDFILLDEGKPQKIGLFSVESDRPLSKPVEPLPPGTFTNRPEYRGQVQTSVTAILLDGLNTRFEDQAYARQQVIKFLEQLQPEDHIALYVLRDNLRVLHDFTDDARPLLRALGRYKGHVPTALQTPGRSGADPGSQELAGLRPQEALLTRELDGYLSCATRRMAEFYVERRMDLTLRTLEAIADHLGRFPGRKNLIWVSGSFPFSMGIDAQGRCALNFEVGPRTFLREIERTARALNNANLAVYPVDARGLVAIGSGRAYEADMLIRTQGTMEILAERTGGKAYYNQNDIQGAIRWVVDDARVTYVLGYYPIHSRWDGKFREIKISVRRPGLRIRYRRGYFALEEQPLGEKEGKAVLDEAAWSPLEATSIDLKARVRPAQASGENSLDVYLVIGPCGATFQQQDDRWVGTLDVLLVQPDAEGRKLSGVSSTLDMHLRSETYQHIQRNGVSLTQQVKIQPNAHQLRVVIRDRVSGALGSVIVPLSQFVNERGS